MCALGISYIMGIKCPNKVFLNYFTLIGTFVLVYTEKQAHKSYRIVFFFLNSQRLVSARVGLSR